MNPSPNQLEPTSTHGHRTRMEPGIGYILSRFPKISETFILQEMTILQGMGMRIELFPLLLMKSRQVHQQVERMEPFLHHQPLLSKAALQAQWKWLKEAPRPYRRMWREAVQGNLRSPKMLSRALAVAPHAAHYAHRIRDLNLRHLHAHFGTHAALTAYCIHRLTGVPYSFTLHAHDLYVDRTMLREKIEAAAFVITISDYNRTLLENLYGERLASKVEVIRCGVDLTRFSVPDTPSKSQPATIVCIASLEDYKGQDHLLEAIGQLRERGLTLRCVLIGEGERRRALESKVRQLCLSHAVILTGALPHHEVRKKLEGATLYVQPSVITRQGKMEGIPVALMEAMAMQVPVVATRISGIPELLRQGKCGLLVPPSDAHALADAIASLLNDPTLARRLADAARHEVREHYDLHRNVARLHSRFSRVLAP